MKKQQKKRIGQAPALSRSLWKEWVKFIAAECGARVAVVLRCSEALCLKREDISVRGEIPKITKATGETQGNRKSPGEVYVRKTHVTWLKSLLSHGFTVQRQRKHKHGSCDFADTYEVPAEGFIFTSRKGAQDEHLHYQAIYAHAKRQAPRFLDHLKKTGKKWGPEVAKLRPHSGRATLITELMGEGLSTALSMKRHAPGSVKVHMKYGRLTLMDVKIACDALDGTPLKSNWTQVSSQQLKSASKKINAELQRRAKRPFKVNN
eukprot:Skav232857  [mRNA]  locus=scaffold2451:29008:30210:- [translate_table: standard]